MLGRREDGVVIVSRFAFNVFRDAGKNALNLFSTLRTGRGKKPRSHRFGRS